MSDLVRKLPGLGGLVAFEAAYRHLSFTRAADELALSQASVSRRIRELEEDLGVTLFERRRYDVEPTEHAERFARTVRPALHDIADTAHQLRGVNAPERTVTVFSDLCLGSSLVAPVVGRFQREHPDIDLRILASYDSIATTTEEFDIGLQYGAYAPHRYDITPVVRDDIFPICSPAIAKELGASPSVAEVLAYPLIHLAEVGKDWTDWTRVLAALGHEGDPIEDKLVFNSYQVCLDVAENGDGITLGWETSVQDRLDRGSLVAVDSMRVDLGDTINLYRPKDRKTSKVAGLFAKMMLERVESLST